MVGHCRRRRRTSEAGFTTLACLAQPIRCSTVEIRRATVLSLARTALSHAQDDLASQTCAWTRMGYRPIAGVPLAQFVEIRGRAFKTRGGNEEKRE